MALPHGLVATLVLVRHGESTWVAEGRFQGRGDPPLSELGRRQAALVAERLANRERDAPLPIPAGSPIGVWHSPLKRAAQTADRIARSQAAPVPRHATPALTEIAQGEWEGLLKAEVMARWPAELDAWRTQPATSHAPGGESLAEAVARVGDALGEIVTALENASPAGGRPPYEPVSGYPRTPGTTGQPLGVEPWAIAVAHDGIFRLCLMTLIGVPVERFWSFPFDLCAITVVTLSAGVAALRAHNLGDHVVSMAARDVAPAAARGDRGGAL